jgi:hypothetical protein
MGFAKNLQQDVTHWPLTGSDGYGGFTYGTPIKLAGRWEEKQELFLTPDGEEKLSQAICYLNTDVSAGDYLALGDFATTPIADPTTTSGFRARNYSKVTDLRALNALRKVWL